MCSSFNVAFQMNFHVVHDERETINSGLVKACQ